MKELITYLQDIGIEFYQLTSHQKEKIKEQYNRLSYNERLTIWTRFNKIFELRGVKNLISIQPTNVIELAEYYSLEFDQDKTQEQQTEKHEVKIFEVKQKEPKYSKDKPKLTVPQIALLCLYNNVSVTRNNANETMKKYGLNSGESLYQNYSKYSKLRKRTTPEETRQKSENKIKLFEIVIKILSGSAKENATADLTKLMIAIKNEYPE